jgi:hypothetical protein
MGGNEEGRWGKWTEGGDEVKGSEILLLIPYFFPDFFIYRNRIMFMV